MKLKKIISLVLIGVMLIASFSGCGKNGKYEDLLDKDDPVTITIWHYYNGVQQTWFDEMVSEFNNSVGLEKGIIVEAISKNSVGELSDSILASAQDEPGADELPDIFATYAETAYIVDGLGKVADLKKYITDDELSEYVDSYITEGSFDGGKTLKIFPTAKSTEVLMVNKTDWDKFAAVKGVTYDDMKTWEGLVRVAETYYEYTDELTPEIKNDGKAFFGRDSVANYLNIGAVQLGNPFAVSGEDGTVTTQLDKDTIRRLWDNYYVPYVKGYYMQESRYRSDDAKIGSIIALIGSSTAATYFPKEVTIDDEYTYPIENVVLPVPNFEGCDAYIVQQGAGMSVVKSDEKSEYASIVFLKWFTEADRNIMFSVNSGYLPVKKEANDMVKIQKINEENNLEIDDTMQRTIEVAISEVDSYNLYTSPAYEKSANVRQYIEQYMNDTSAAAYDEAWSRIISGSEKDSILDGYTNDAAFEQWYKGFEKGFMEIVE